MRGNHEQAASLLRSRGGSLSLEHAGQEACAAASAGDVEYLRRLLRHGCPPDSADYDARTAAHLACAEGRAACAMALAEAGANFEAKDRWGHTPLTEAEAHGHAALAAALRALSAAHREGGGGGGGGAGDGGGAASSPAAADAATAAAADVHSPPFATQPRGGRPGEGGAGGAGEEASSPPAPHHASPRPQPAGGDGAPSFSDDDNDGAVSHGSAASMEAALRQHASEEPRARGSPAASHSPPRAPRASGSVAGLPSGRARAGGGGHGSGGGGGGGGGGGDRSGGDGATVRAAATRTVGTWLASYTPAGGGDAGGTPRAAGGEP